MVAQCPLILVFPVLNIFAKFKYDHLLWGIEYMCCEFLSNWLLQVCHRCFFPHEPSLPPCEVYVSGYSNCRVDADTGVP